MTTAAAVTPAAEEPATNPGSRLKVHVSSPTPAIAPLTDLIDKDVGGLPAFLCLVALFRGRAHSMIAFELTSPLPVGKIVGRRRQCSFREASQFPDHFMLFT